MENFSLEKWETGNYDVFTRDRRKVRILCTNADLYNPDYPIIALAKISHFDRNIEEVNYYSINGEYNPGKNGNPRDLMLSEKKWKPADEEIYFYIGTWFEIEHTCYDKDCLPDQQRIEFGNCFRTIDEAKKYAEKIKQVFD
ncbi:MAG: hypothetical protein MJ204_02785 [Bacteroidales bacterium]|nr:hypothetical protein [Bacteroidales bacterium]MCQ2605454.1 hypothetical protein [Bacteroidales bacterium]